MRNLPLRIASFNIKVATEAPVASIARDLNSLRADLCAFQEVGVHWSMGTPLNQVAYLASALGHQASAWLPLLERPWADDPYRGGPFEFKPLRQGQNTRRDAGQFGIGLSAHGSFTERHSHYLHQKSDEQRGALEVIWCETSLSRPLHIFCVHLSVHEKERLIQTRELIQRSQAIEGPALLIGDLNDTPDSQCLRELQQASWRDLCAPYRVPFTFSVASPHKRLDYILGRNVECINAGVATEITTSDHFPLWADIIG